MLGTYIALDCKLFRIADVWMGRAGESAEVLLEDCDTGQFNWRKEEEIRNAIKVHPD
jgi:hypothetical protein